MDQQEIAVQKFQEVADELLPPKFKEKTPEELYKFLKEKSDAFVQSVSRLCLNAGIGEVERASVERSEAAKLNMIKHGSIYVNAYSINVVPKRFMDVIDKIEGQCQEQSPKNQPKKSPLILE